MNTGWHFYAQDREKQTDDTRSRTKEKDNQVMFIVAAISCEFQGLIWSISIISFWLFAQQMTHNNKSINAKAKAMGF